MINKKMYASAVIEISKKDELLRLVNKVHKQGPSMLHNTHTLTLVGLLEFQFYIDMGISHINAKKKDFFSST